MSKRFGKLSHSIYECKYHVVFCAKYRFRIFKDDIARYTRQQIHVLCCQKDLVEVLELRGCLGFGFWAARAICRRLHRCFIGP